MEGSQGVGGATNAAGHTLIIVSCVFDMLFCFFFFLLVFLSPYRPASPPTTTFYLPVLLLSWKLKNESQRGKMKVPPSTPDNLKTDVGGPRCNTSVLGLPPGGSSALRFQGRKWQFCALIIAHGRASCLSPSPLCVHNADRDKIKLEILLTGCSGGRKLRRGWEEDQVSWGLSVQQKMCKCGWKWQEEKSVPTRQSLIWDILTFSQFTLISGEV